MEKRNRINVDVSGRLFKVSKEILKNGPQSGLSRLLLSDEVSELSVLEIDRPADIFAAFIAWYQTGELHIPTTSCPRAFLNELEFWEISPEVLTSCCGKRLQAFLTEQDTLLNFGRSTSEDCTTPPCNSCRCFQSIRAKIWEIVEYNKSSIPGKIYFITTLIMVLLSIFTLACSTDPSFQRAITNCERLEYMESANMEDYEYVKKTLEKYCDDVDIPVPKSDPLLRNTYPFETPPEEENDDFKTVLFEIEEEDTVTTTSGNKTVLPMSAIPGNDTWNVGDSFLPGSKFVRFPNMKVPVYVLMVLEVITIAYFTIDIFLRLFSCPHIGRYFLSIINVTDAAAIVFTYAHLIWSYIYTHEQYTNNMVDLLEIFQMLRSLRLFRIVSNVKAGRVLAYSLRANLHDLFVMLLFLLSCVCVFSSCLFIVDHGKSVTNIPEGWYWAVVTMTTVGYGDIVPKTTLGRFVTCVCMLSGVLLFALTVPIFANNFLTLYQYAGEEHHMKSVRRKRNSPPVELSAHKEESMAGTGHCKL